MNVIIKSKSTRLLSAFLAILMVAAMLPVTAFAWTAEEGTKCTSTYGDLYLGSDGNNYYSKAGNTLFYNDDGSFYVSYHNGGVARYKYLMIDSNGTSHHVYARENNLNVVLRTTDAIGLPVDAFIPYFNLVVDGFEHSRKIKAVKKSLCNQNGITYCEINSKDPFAMAAQIKALFRKNHVYITSENENDIRFCRNLFFSVKRKNARTS